MKVFFFLSFYLLFACSKSNLESNFKVKKDMSFDEFKLKLNEYTINKSYPDIDK